ncbi:MAG TPA: restriction endonuclease subunit S [Rhodanobacteraceae bacterium]|nr:restriction endonuclease subunit S [Rhodanobacteraceae bacterium]
MSAEWTTSRVEDLSVNFDGKRRPVKGSERRLGPYPYYGASGVVDHVDDYLFDGEYLLVAEDGENLRTRQTPIAFLARGKFWVNNHAHIITGSERADTRFLMYALRHVDIDAYLTGAVMPKLTQGNLNRIEVSHPGLDEQRAIAGVLGALDDKIEQNRRTVQTLEKLARAIFRAWFVDFEPVKAKAAGATGFPSMPQAVFDALPTTFVDSDIGTVPEGWDVKPIGEVVTVKGGATPSTKKPEYWDSGMHCWATPKDLSHLWHPVLLDTDRHITDAGASVISSGLLPVGTVLLSSRAPVGYLAIAVVPTAINQGFIAMICDGMLPPTYVYQWAAASMETIKTHASGTTFAEISKKAFRPLPIVEPTDNVVTAYKELVEPLFELLTGCVKESTRLAELRDYLLPKLLSGTVRAANPVPETIG